MAFYDADVVAGGVTQTLLELTKSILGITDNSRDADLSLYLDMAGAAAEQYIDNIIDKRPVTEQFKHVNPDPIALRYWPADNLTKVAVDGTDVTTDYVELTQDGLHWVLKETGAESRCWTQMDVTYDAGYDPIPPDIAYAIARGAIAYDNDVVSTGPVKKETVVGVGSVEYDTGLAESTSYGMLPSASTAALEKYRRYYA